MKRGSIAIVIILLVAVGAAAVSVWYHYANQRLVQDFWGTNAALLISQAPEVTAMRLGEPGQAMSPDEEGESPAAVSAPDGQRGESDPAAEPLPVAIEFNQVPWLVVASRSAVRAKGIGNLRRALVLDTTYDWSVSAEKEPHWQYALDMNDGRNFVAVLFDFDTRQVALAGGRRTAVMDSAAAGEFQQFFEEQFADDAKEAAQPAEEEADLRRTDAEKPDTERPNEAEPAEAEASGGDDQDASAPSEAPE